jgi:hypothetical protein
MEEMNMRQLSGLDAAFLYAEVPSIPMHIGPLLIYDPSTTRGGFVRFKDILAIFEQRLDRSPVFRRKLKMVPLALDQGTVVGFQVRPDVDDHHAVAPDGRPVGPCGADLATQAGPVTSPPAMGVIRRRPSPSGPIIISPSVECGTQQPPHIQAAIHYQSGTRCNLGPWILLKQHPRQCAPHTACVAAINQRCTSPRRPV